MIVRNAVQDDKSDGRASVPAAEVIRNFGYWQHRALEAPLFITHHGRSRVVLVSVDQYDRLKAASPGGVGSGEVELKQFLDNAAEGFIAYDAELRLLQLNKVAEDFFGATSAEVVGKHVENLDVGPINPDILSRVKRVHETRETMTYQAPSHIFPGRYLSLRIFPYGKGTAILFQNVTERERLRAQAATAASVQRAVQDVGKIAVLKFDGRRQMYAADGYLTELTGFTLDDLAGVRLINCVAPEDRVRAQNFFDEIPSKDKSDGVVLNVIVKSGDTRRLRLVAAPILRDFMPTGFMVLVSPVEAVD